MPSELQLALEGRTRGRVQPKLRVGAPNDPHELEADRVADEVLRMPAPFPAAPSPESRTPSVRRAAAAEKAETKPEEDDELVRRQAVPPPASREPAPAGGDPSRETAPAVSASVERQLSSAHEGIPLPASTRAFFESRFACDFSRVRVHTGGRAAASADSIDALAYTFGDQIVFNAGQFAPETSDGRRLLAHELTHVVQQSPQIRRKEQAAPAAPVPVGPTPEPVVVRGDVRAAERVVRRQLRFFAPQRGGGPSGAEIHNAVLPLFLKCNDNLFIEAPIPGATKADRFKGAKGRADFYRTATNPAQSRTIGLNFRGEEPVSLPAGPLESSVSGYNHSRQSAPRGSTGKTRVTRVAAAPGDIFIGELKPGSSAEGQFGRDQIASYHSGIRQTADALNLYAPAHPGAVDSTRPWNPQPHTLTGLAIPDVVTYPNGRRFTERQLGLYETSGKTLSGLGVKEFLDDTGLKGRLYVYADSVPGVWSYEWIPTNIPTTSGNEHVQRVLNGLNRTVIPQIRATTPALTAPRKAISGRTPAVHPAPQPVVRRNKKFNRKAWEDKVYEPWAKDAEKFLGDKKAVGKATVATALVEVENRSRKNLGISSGLKEEAKGLEKIRHWNRYGKLYGVLKEKFGFVGDKLQAFADWVKKKIKNLTRKLGVTKFGDWLMATARVIFKIFKLVGAWAVRTALNELVGSFQRGVSNNINKLVDMATPEGVTSKIEEFDALKNEYQQILDQKQDELIKRFFGSTLDLFEKLSEFEAIADKAGTIVAIVKWGVRLLACASPPAIGCLWNLAIEALQAAFAMLLQTCWFTKKVAGPVLSKVELVKSFPTKVASGLANVANRYVPVPAGFDPLFAPIELNLTDFDVDCEEAGDNGPPLTPERQAILDLMEKIGDEKFSALLELMSKRAAGPWVLVTPERIRALETALQDVDAKTLKELAAEPSTAPPKALEEFLKDISKYTKKEKETAKKYFESKQAAQAATEGAAKGGGKREGAGGPASDVQVVDGSKHGIKGPRGGTRLPNMFAFVLDGSLEDERSQVKSITVYIVVDRKLRYQVENVKVLRVTLEKAPSPEFQLVVYHLQPGLEFDIDGQQVQFEKAVLPVERASTGSR